jgi:CheY-like chemotaxis protein
MEVMSGETLSNTKYTILVVDDIPTNVGIMSQAVASLGTVLIATDGKTAISIAQTQEPDLILLDIPLTMVLWILSQSLSTLLY